MTATLAELVARNARLHARRPALVFEGRRYTHAEHAERIYRLANALLQRGVRPGDRIAVISQNRSEFLELFGAAAVAGFILAPVNWRLAPAEMGEILRDSEPAVVCCEAQFAAAFAAAAPDIARTVLRIGLDGAANDAVDYETLLRSGASAPPVPAPGADDIAWLIYTSGTTGRPKGAMWSHGALMASASAIAGLGGLRPTDRMLISMPLFHVGARIEGLAVEYFGGASCLLRQFDEIAAFAAIERERLTMAHLAPVMAKRLAEHPERTRFDLSTLASIHYGSAPVPVEELKRAVAALGSIFTQVYGMTEHLPSSMLLPYQQELDGDERALGRLASAGQPFPGTEFRIVADDGRTLGTGEVGEILVRSAGMMKGYWRKPELTAEAIRDGWLHTGDVGYLDEEGYLFIVDRKKDMIISGGENIYSREVEEALLAHPAVAEAAVIGVPDAQWGEAVKAVVVLREGFAPSAAALIDHCRARIASYKKPRSIEFAAALPRLPHGKVDKKALRAAHRPTAT